MRERIRSSTSLVGAGAGGAAFAVGVLAGLSPQVGILVAFGLAFGVFTIANITVGICVLTPILFLDNYPKTDILATALLAIAWLAAVSSGREVPNLFRDHPAFGFTLVAFVAWALLSASWSGSSGTALLAGGHYLQDAFMFPIVYAGLRDRRHLMWVLTAFILAAAGVAVLAILHPVADPSAVADASRASGPISSADQLAAELVPGLALALTIAGNRTRAGSARAGLVVVALLCLGGIVLSLSRGGLVALMTALAAGVLVAGRWRGRALVTAGTLVACMALYFFAFASLPARERVTNVGGGGSGRLDLWTVGERMVQAHPLQGVGAGNFKLASIHYLLRPGLVVRANYIITTPKVAHNAYLEVLAELGIVGATAFLAIVGFSLRCALLGARAAERRGDRSLEILARGLFVAMTGTLTAAIFLSINYGEYLWLLLALGPAVLRIARAEDSSPVESPTSVEQAPGRLRLPGPAAAGPGRTLPFGGGGVGYARRPRSARPRRTLRP